MDLFELLFIALFLLFPILEQVLKRGKRSGPEPPGHDADTAERAPGGRSPSSAPSDPSSRPAGREPVRAADMVPDDLWAVLTGEERPRAGVETTAEPEDPAETTWWMEEEPALEGPSVEEPPVDEPSYSTPVSLEYSGPEAYSLEPVDQKAVSLETPVPTPEERHRRFHERVDRPPPRRRARRSPINRALKTPEGLRQAFVLSEVLGTPKGLE